MCVWPKSLEFLILFWLCAIICTLTGSWSPCTRCLHLFIHQIVLEHLLWWPQGTSGYLGCLDLNPPPPHLRKGPYLSNIPQSPKQTQGIILSSFLFPTLYIWSICPAQGPLHSRLAPPGVLFSQISTQLFTQLAPFHLEFTLSPRPSAAAVAECSVSTYTLPLCFPLLLTSKLDHYVCVSISNKETTSMFASPVCPQHAKSGTQGIFSKYVLNQWMQPLPLFSRHYRLHFNSSFPMLPCLLSPPLGPPSTQRPGRPS